MIIGLWIVSAYAIVVFALLRTWAAPFKRKPSSHCERKNKDTVSSQLPGDIVLVDETKNKDTISQLPDDILISIIKRLSLKAGIRTSILSKRWRNLHKSVPDISLVHNCGGCFPFDKDWHGPTIIMKSVNRFLRLCSGSKIRSFSLHCCLNESVTQDVEQCMHCLGRMGVEKLDLTCCGHIGSSDLSFSCHLLSELPSLKYFRLYYCRWRPSLKGQCNSLQTLILRQSTLLPGAIECILSNCLKLQELVLLYCICPSKLCFSGSNLRLKSLEILGCAGVEEIELRTSNLVELRVGNYQVVKYIFDHAPRLQSVSLDISTKDMLPYVGMKLAQDVPRLEKFSFVIRGNIFQRSSGYLGNNMFNNLRKLDSTVYYKMDLLLFIPLLQSCPLLEEFELYAHLSDYDEGSQERKKHGKNGFVHSELKKVEISGFVGTENYIEFALYILKSATRLEQMCIYRDMEKSYFGLTKWLDGFATPWSEETLRKIHTQLQGQAVSKIAQLTIQHRKPRTACHIE